MYIYIYIYTHTHIYIYNIDIIYIYICIYEKTFMFLLELYICIYIIYMHIYNIIYKSDVSPQKYFYIFVTQFSLLCISCGSYNITVRNNKNTSKRLSICTSQIAVFPNSKNSSSFTLPILLSKECVSVSENEFVHWLNDWFSH